MRRISDYLSSNEKSYIREGVEKSETENLRGKKYIQKLFASYYVRETVVILRNFEDIL